MLIRGDNRRNPGDSLTEVDRSLQKTRRVYKYIKLENRIDNHTAHSIVYLGPTKNGPPGRPATIVVRSHTAINTLRQPRSTRRQYCHCRRAVPPDTESMLLAWFLVGRVSLVWRCRFSAQDARYRRSPNPLPRLCCPFFYPLEKVQDLPSGKQTLQFTGAKQKRRIARTHAD